MNATASTSGAGVGAALERKIRLDGDAVEYRCRTLAVSPGRRAVLAFVMSRPYRPPFAGAPEVPAGAVTLAHYWRRAPYNLYYWVDGAGGERGAYFNLCRPPTRIGRRLVEYRDLALDLWVAPGGTHLLDREEVPRSADPSLRHEVATALRALRREWRRRLMAARRAAHGHLERLARSWEEG
jgi:hypothetical protein